MSPHSVGSCRRLSGFKDIPAIANLTSLVSMPLFESSSAAQAAVAMQPCSPTSCQLRMRSFSCPNLDEYAYDCDAAYDPTSCSCPSRYSQGRCIRSLGQRGQRQSAESGGCMNGISPGRQLVVSLVDCSISYSTCASQEQTGIPCRLE